jgi:putative ABC transport system permease protein
MNTISPSSGGFGTACRKHRPVKILRRSPSGVPSGSRAPANGRCNSAPCTITKPAGSYRDRLLILLAAVGTVLLIGCGNVSNLLLARGAARARELALRNALGAGRARLVRQLLTESLVLGVSAAAAGAALAHVLLQLLITYVPAGVPRLEQSRIDSTALLFAALTALAASLVFGVVPALRAASTDVTTALKEGGRGTVGGARDIVRSSLIAGEVALALVLLVVAGVLIRSAIATQSIELGFRPQGLLTARLLLPDAKYQSADSVRLAAQRLEDAVAAIPGVTGVAVAHTIPSVRSFNNGLIPEGLPMELRYSRQCDGIFVSGGYFATMGQRLLRGRTFAATDDNRVPPVTVVNETLARHFWPGQDAIGKRLRGTSPRGLGTVIGIVADVRAGGPAEPPPPTFYVPLSQMDDQTVQRGLFVVARSDGDPTRLGPGIRTAVSAIDDTIPLYGVVPMEERLAGTLRTARFATMLLTLLAVIGLVLAAVGIYGVIGYFAAQRRSEIGIRMALGATRAQVVHLVLRQALRPTLAGLAIGLTAAVFATQAIASQLVNVRPTDPITFAAVATVLLLVAVAAALVPARRASRLDPTRALDMS